MNRILDRMANIRVSEKHHGAAGRASLQLRTDVHHAGADRTAHRVRPDLMFTMRFDMQAPLPGAPYMQTAVKSMKGV